MEVDQVDNEEVNGDEIQIISQTIPLSSSTSSPPSRARVPSSSPPARPSSSLSSASATSSSNPQAINFIIAEATRFSADLKRYAKELKEANDVIKVKEAELAEKNRQIRVYAELVNEQQERITNLENEREGFNYDGGAPSVDIREMKKMVAVERKMKEEAEEKWEKLKKSVGEFSAEFSGLVQQLETDSEEVGDGDDFPEGEGDANVAPGQMERLSKFVRNKFQSWVKSQSKLKAELARMTQRVTHMGQVLDGKTFKKPVEPGTPTQKLRPRVSPSPSPTRKPLKLEKMGEEPKCSPKKLGASPGKRALHGIDTSKIYRGFFCLCGTEYSTKSNLTIHVRTFTEKGNFQCDICDQPFVLYYMLRRHQKDKHNVDRPKGEVGCNCGKVFSSFLNLYKHRKIAHARVPRAPRNKNLSGFGSVPEDPEIEFEYEDEYGNIEIVGTHSLNPEAEMPSTSKGSPPVARKFATVTTNGAIYRQFTTTREPAGNSRQVQQGTQVVSYSGKMHGMNIAKRHQGFFCICGTKFITRKRLDGHIQFYNRRAHEDGQSRGPNYNENWEEENEGDDADYEDYQTQALPVAEGPQENDNLDHRADPRKELACICGFETHNKYNLTKHIKYNTIERKFACENCPLRFVAYSYLRRHYLRSHKDRETYNRMKTGTGCSKCGMTFQNVKAFLRHRKTAHRIGGGYATETRPRPVVSTTQKPNVVRNAFGRFCAKPGSGTGDRLQQKKSGNSKPASNFSGSRKFRCTHCPQRYPTLHQLMRHKKGAHKIVQKGFAIGCVDCGISFTNRRDHTQHRITVHQSAIGRKRISKTEDESPLRPPRLKPEGTWESPLHSPEPEPIPFDFEDDNAETPSTSRQRYSDQLEENDGEHNSGTVHEIDMSRENEGFFCVCGTQFTVRKNLLSHVRRTTGRWNFQCKLCKKHFFYNSTLKRHMLFTHKIKNAYSSKEKGCVVCGKTFGSLMILRQHIKYEHPNDETGEESRPVDHAWRQQKSKKIKKIGSLRKSTPAKQEADVAETSSSENQVAHGIDVSRAHEGHYCLCGKNCNSERALIVHVKYQARERNLPCGICGQRFICPSYLRQHMRKSHKMEDGKRVPQSFKRCVKCRKTFKTNVELFRHNKKYHNLQGSSSSNGAVKTGSQVGSFRRQIPRTAPVADADDFFHEALEDSAGRPICSCGKAYFSKSGLQRHVRLQNHGKVYQCSLCPNLYCEHRNLQRHMEKHHGVGYQSGMHGCGICAKVFATHGDVVQHRVQDHGMAR